MSATFETRADEEKLIADGVDEEPPVGNQRSLGGWQRRALYWAGVLFTAFALVNLNYLGLETWAYRTIHVVGGLILGFALVAAWSVDRPMASGPLARFQSVPLLIGGLAGAWALFCVVYAYVAREIGGADLPPDWVFNPIALPVLGEVSLFGLTLTVSVVVGIVSSWLFPGPADRVHWPDIILLLASLTIGGFFVFHFLHPDSMMRGAFRMRAGTLYADPASFWAAMSSIFLILELTRRVAGLALVTIALVFVLYSFAGPYLPGILEHDGYTLSRFFTKMFTDIGVLSAPIAVSSTYIILFITFAAFLQASKVGDYFVNFAFAAAGRARGGPAKVAVFASGLMGMINGTSAGNVVATGSLTIPLMKKVGYRPKTAGAVEAAASTGGQIMPPIMGAGAFIMAEITGIPYTELIISALIPAVLYFMSVYFMVDLEAVKMGMRGMSQSELPNLNRLMKQVYLFIPVIILIVALFAGYSVIRAGTYSMAAAMVVSWLSPHKMGPRRIVNALELAARMSIQLIAVCACAGIIVGVIGLTGVGLKFSSMLLGIAETSQLLALVFAMLISMLLGMGMPTTAAYAVAASVVAPGLQQLGIPPLIAHFFVFYFAVISAITPPVALASYAGAAIAGSDPLGTSVTSFKLGLAAYIVPFMFFYSPSILMVGTPLQIGIACVTASIGIFFLASAVQGWMMGRMNLVARAALLLAAVMMIKGGLETDAIGIPIGLAVALYQYKLGRREIVPAPAGGLSSADTTSAAAAPARTAPRVNEPR
ncbi:MAG: TRAP transporter fused permease subunit [Alphaproteobacteria bacterium]|jgi:TRAP transporter 4TM/12TM fusion protein|nr:TRAP transporter fused permease subunit [Alphaproteobacteria bacterium]